jgi:anti-sigma factor RsiW
MRCGKVQKMLSASFDGRLEDARQTAVEAHLSGCPACQRFADNLLRCGHFLSVLEFPGPRPGFTERLMARLPERRTGRLYLRGRFEALRPAPAVAAAVAFACGVFLATSMNGEQPPRFAQEDPGQTLYAESFDAFPSDSAGAQYLTLLQETED